MKSIAGYIAALVCVATPAFGQTGAAPKPAETRPATTSTAGDTGLWFVPTGEILPARKWSVSGYYVNFDFEQGFTDVSTFPLTVGYGLADRFELFGNFTPVTRIDRDVRPLFSPQLPSAGGVVNEYPFVNDGWSGNQIGDLWLGAKFNLSSQYRQQPVAFAIRGMAKLPTASDEDGAGTGKMDFAFDGIVSKELNERVELSAFGGMIFRGDPDTFDLLNGIRWGFGAGFPTRKSLRFTAELHGEQYLDDAVRFTGAQTQTIPIDSEQSGPINASLGLTWQGRNGLFAGVGVNYALRVDGRSNFGTFEDEGGDAAGVQFRLGYHPGTRIYVAPAPPAPPRAACGGGAEPSADGACPMRTLHGGDRQGLDRDRRRQRSGR